MAAVPLSQVNWFPTCISWSPNFGLGQAVLLVFGIAKVTDFEQGSAISIQ